VTLHLEVGVMESRWLSRMPVYDILKGRVIGRVHRLILDADARKVVGLVLAPRLGREPRCLPFRNVHSIGEHAVTVRGTDVIVPLSELPEMEEAYRAQRRIYNSPILTESGSFVGDVDEYTINPQSGRLEALLVSGGLIRDLFRGQAALPAHLIVAIGEDATIVKDVAVAFLEQRRQEQLKGNGRAAEEETPAQERGTEGWWRERLRRALGREKRLVAERGGLRPDGGPADAGQPGVIAELTASEPRGEAVVSNQGSPAAPPAAETL